MHLHPPFCLACSVVTTVLLDNHHVCVITLRRDPVAVLGREKLQATQYGLATGEQSTG